MRTLFGAIVIGILGMSVMMSSCKKGNESAERLARFAQEINQAPDKDLANGTVLTGCQYNVGDSVFTYQIKVSDNRFDNLELDSIKRNFEKTVKSPGMSKIVNLVSKANLGLRYTLVLPDKEVSVDFPHSELADISNAAGN